MSATLALKINERQHLLSVIESYFRDFLPTSSVLQIGESGVVHVQIRFILGHKVVAIVKVTGVPREPGGFRSDIIVSDQRSAFQGGRLPKRLQQLQQALPGHLDLDQGVQLVAVVLAGARLQMADGSLVFFDRF